MVGLSFIGLALAALPLVHAGFGLTERGSSFIVDTNAGLVFTGTCFLFISSTRPCSHFIVDSSSGDLTSIVFNDVEVRFLLGHEIFDCNSRFQTQDSSKHSQIASGIGASCTWVSTVNESDTGH